MIRALVVLLLAAGCETRTPREAYDCTCNYLTDTDVPGEQKTAVCVEQGKQPESAASECVAGMGVGHIEKCTCTKQARPCAEKTCGD